jgi:hypothetical protein
MTGTSHAEVIVSRRVPTTMPFMGTPFGSSYLEVDVLLPA